jgi:hypothetical protein
MLRLGLEGALCCMRGRKISVRSVAVFPTIIAAVAIVRWRE